jgi:serine/threonine-protein kinase
MSVSEDSTLENSRRLIDKSTNGEIVVVPGHSNVQDATLVAGSASDRALDATLSPEPGQTRALSATLTVEPHVETGLANTLFADNVVPSSRGGFPVLEWERYEFLSLLGEGGMGSVYKARDKRLDRIVALKFIHSTDQAMIARFLQEARAQARLDNPFICKVYEVGEVQRQAYIAMQFVDGKSLENAATSMSLNEKVLIVQKVAEAIHAAHRIGIIHRDVKPANIMIERTADGSLNPILTDFGIAREAGEGQGLTETGMVMGTPAFMAPEQARGNTSAIDHRSDVYSLGATLYNLIASLPPFYANSVVDILLKVISEDATPLRTHVPSVPPDLETIVMKCLNKEPNHRYNSAKALAEDLGRYLDGDRILGQRLGFIARWQRRVRKHKTLFAVSALSAMIVLILAAGGVRQYLVNQREQHRLAEQARIEQELAQRLGQEITNLEWVLRSARQLPLHNLEREKVIVRERMAKLQADLASYGELSRGLASYALGRGHMALHEYPQALERLHQAMELGKQTPDVHYALGVVLGKQFEQAMYEARLAGGGDWAKKQREELEPKYLAPAIASLQRSRAADLDSPMYLEGLIAYYGRDYEGSLRYAAKALESAPWLYEAHKLMGDIHLERALQARDSGKYKEAETEFAGALKSYEAAAAIGQSDGEVYEGLAECWVRQIQMAVYQGQPAETAYAAAIAASDKITIAEPQSIAGLLKKAYAANMAMAVSGVGLTAAERVRQCLVAAEGVLEKQPGHPYASDVAANCNVLAADAASASHQDPKPFLRKALSLLEPTVKQYPHFLWGLNDLGYATIFFGLHLQLHGDRTAKETLQ